MSQANFVPKSLFNSPFAEIKTHIKSPPKITGIKIAKDLTKDDNKILINAHSKQLKGFIEDHSLGILCLCLSTALWTSY